jgi:hypothetical protein
VSGSDPRRSFEYNVLVTPRGPVIIDLPVSACCRQQRRTRDAVARRAQFVTRLRAARQTSATYFGGKCGRCTRRLNWRPTAC